MYWIYHSTSPLSFHHPFLLDYILSIYTHTSPVYWKFVSLSDPKMKEKSLIFLFLNFSRELQLRPPMALPPSNIFNIWTTTTPKKTQRKSTGVLTCLKRRTVRTWRCAGLCQVHHQRRWCRRQCWELWPNEQSQRRRVGSLLHQEGK